VPAKLKALLAIAAAVQHGGLDVTAELVARARAPDATDLEIHDTVLIAALFCLFNRHVDGLATIAPNDPALYAAGRITCRYGIAGHSLNSHFAGSLVSVTGEITSIV